MSTVGITENVKGDNKKFEIWYNGREEVYIIQVTTIFFFFLQGLCFLSIELFFKKVFSFVTFIVLYTQETIAFGSFIIVLALKLWIYHCENGHDFG